MIGNDSSYKNLKFRTKPSLNFCTATRAVKCAIFDIQSNERTENKKEKAELNFPFNDIRHCCYCVPQKKELCSR